MSGKMLHKLEMSAPSCPIHFILLLTEMQEQKKNVTA